jgi:hypothetical protein
MKSFKTTMIAAALVLSSSAARAETPWNVFKKFGMTGNWSADCSAAPSGTNFWMTYKKGPEGKVYRPLDRGDGDTLAATIDSAEILADTTTMRASFRNDDPSWGDTNGTVANILIEKKDGRIRTLDSKGADGKEYIKDGIVISSGHPIPWLEKCKGSKPKPAPAAGAKQP